MKKVILYIVMVLAIINSLMALNSLNERKLLEAEIRRNDEKYEEAVNKYINSKAPLIERGFNDFLLIEEFEQEAELLKQTETIKPSNLHLGDRDENTWAFAVTLILNLLLVYLLIIFHKTKDIKPNNI